MGGTMNAPLLVALVEEMGRRNWAVLRFNFRGIGESLGEAGIGLDEVADARAAIGSAQARFHLPIGIAGWSFGGAVAIRTASGRDDLVGVCGIAPAIKEKPGITAGSPPAAEVHLGTPLMVVVGANDDLVDPEDARTWTEAAGGEFIEMKGANHFFWGKYEDLAHTVGGFFTPLV
jgi:alpha/beta superfamily hydrolase